MQSNLVSVSPSNVYDFGRHFPIARASRLIIMPLGYKCISSVPFNGLVCICIGVDHPKL